MKSKTRVYVVLYSLRRGETLLHPPIKGYPIHIKKLYDPEYRRNELLNRLKDGCKNIEFVGGDIISNFDKLEKIEERKDVDGILFYFLGSVPGSIPWYFQDKKLNVSAFKKYPMVLACDRLQFAGGTRFLEFYDLVKKENLPAVPVYSSNFDDVMKILHLIKVIHKMKESKILNIGKSRDIWDHSYSWRWKSNEYLKALKETFGTDVVTIGYKELNEYYQKVDEESAHKLAKKWMDGAIRVVEPNEKEIIKSAKMYFAIKKAMEDVDADAVTIDCIPLFSGERLIPSYPCLAFAQLNDDGSTGVCEADMDATVTQLVMRYLTGRPGFISDQTFDTSAGQMIYWHCIAPTKLFGKDGASASYSIRSTHTGEGVGLQVSAPPNKVVTAVKFSVRDGKIAVHQGKSLGNSYYPGCRTQWVFKAEAEKILDNHEHRMFGRHRVIVFGDYRKEILNLATFLGLEVIEEDA